ncbi:TetR/AcrR family transcriptional regulator [Dinoroseobacter sp. S76]|uniref:TetR/AcrR family transcriptional regulator n=1 Tax=Dinoroseobacter sp. S76 TaxID=3415124 RepID=UPI003C7DB1CF
MKKTEKPRQPDGRDRIIATSTSLFLELGYGGTSMSAIAKACNMTKAALYYHFKSKEDLFSACVTEGYADALARLEEIAGDEKRSSKAKLTEAFRVIYETSISTEVGRMSPLIAEVSRTVPAVARSFHDDYVSPQQETMWSICREGMESGAFRSIDEKLLMHMIYGPVVTLSLSREMFASLENLDALYPIEDLRDGHLNLLLEALGA